MYVGFANVCVCHGTGVVLSPLQFHSLQGYLLVYSITDDTTFSKLDRVREEIMKAQGKAVPVFLVGTKADLAGDRAVSEKERLAKAKAWNCKSFEVSAKTNVGVYEVFEGIIGEVLGGSDAGAKGTGGGSVLGAGRAAQNDVTTIHKVAKKRCIFF